MESGVMRAYWRVPAMLVAASMLLLQVGCVLDAFQLSEDKPQGATGSLAPTSVVSLAYSPDGKRLASSHNPLYLHSRNARVQVMPPPPQIRLWESLLPGQPPWLCRSVFTAPQRTRW